MAHTSSFTPPITGANERTCPCLTYDVTMEQSTTAARRLSREGQFVEIMIKIVPSGLATNPRSLGAVRRQDTKQVGKESCQGIGMGGWA